MLVDVGKSMYISVNTDKANHAYDAIFIKSRSVTDVKR